MNILNVNISKTMVSNILLLVIDIFTYLFTYRSTKKKLNLFLKTF